MPYSKKRNSNKSNAKSSSVKKAKTTKSTTQKRNTKKRNKKEQVNRKETICPLLKKPCTVKEALKPNYSINYIDNTKFTTKSSCETIIINNQLNDEKILNAADAGSQAKKKKKWLNLVYYLLNIVVIAIVLIVQLSQQQNPKESMSAILNINWWFILAAFGAFLLNMFLEQIRYSVLIHKATGVFRLGLSYKIAALGRYYDTITPLGTGGQPFQVLYANKYGIKAGEGISIAMGKYIFFEIVYFILVSYFIFKAVFSGSAATNFISENVGQGVVTTFMWIGYAILACLIIFMLFVSLNRRFGAVFIVGILKLLSKIHIGKFRIIKDYKKSFNKVMRTVNVWQTTTKKYSKSFWVIFVNVVGSFAYFFVNYSIPYFIFCAFVGWSPQYWITIITMTVIVDLTSAFNPIPMGTGTADLSFSVLYSALFVEALGPTLGVGAAIWALIMWRTLSCYIYILQGLAVVNYDYFIGNKRLEKYKEFWMLPLKERIKIKLKNKKQNTTNESIDESNNANR